MSLRRVSTLGSWLFLCASGTAGAQGAIRASDADQQSIELVVAQYMMTGRTPADIPADHPMYDTWKHLTVSPVRPYSPRPLWSGRNFVLEPRLWVSGIVQVDSKTRPVRISLDPPIEPRAELTGAHDSTHLARLATLLGLPAVLDDARACADFAAATRCRYQNFDGYVQLGSAWIRGPAAQIVFRWGEHNYLPPTWFAAGHYSGGYWTCNLVRGVASWQLVSCGSIQL